MTERTRISNIRERSASEGDTGFLRSLHDVAYRDVVVRQFGASEWDERRGYWFERSLAEARFRILETAREVSTDVSDSR